MQTFFYFNTSRPRFEGKSYDDYTKEKIPVIPNEKGYLINVVYFKGWQYSKDRSYYEYNPEEKAFDMSRRRRLIRPRKRDLKATVKQVRF